MRIVRQTVFVSKTDLPLLEKDINAANAYTIFSNKEEGTKAINIVLEIPEEFIITEDLIEVIVSGLLPALSEKEVETKIEQVKSHLRSVGASV